MSNFKFDILKRHGRGKVGEHTVSKELFDTELTSQWVAQKPRGKSKKRREKEKKESGHTSNGYQATAVIHKTGDWSGNFSYFIRSGEGNGRAKVYDTISPALSTVYARKYPLIISYANRYFKLKKVACNFNTKSKIKLNGKSRGPGQKKPYAWEAHHLIPGDVFTQVRAGISKSEPIFTEKQLDLILLSDYDLNHGHNLIALPSNGMDAFQLIHGLIQHPTNHPNYTQHVVKRMKEVRDDLEELEDEIDEPHPDVDVKAGEKLRKIEDSLWDLVIKLGSVAIGKVLQQETEVLSLEEESMIKSSTQAGLNYSLRALC